LRYFSIQSPDKLLNFYPVARLHSAWRKRTGEMVPFSECEKARRSRALRWNSCAITVSFTWYWWSFFCKIQTSWGYTKI